MRRRETRHSISKPSGHFPAEAALQSIDCYGYEPIYWYHPDYLGHTDFVTDRTGQPYQHFFYAPFGEALLSQHTGTGYYNTPYRFNAKELDSETGLIYYGARYYEPKESVWMSVDPLAHKYPGLSGYNFVEGNPIIKVDFNGKEPTVIVEGEDANRAVKELNRGTSLKITRNEQTGVLSARGTPANEAEAKLLEAINSEEIHVLLVTTREATYDSKDGELNNILIPGGYEGSEIVAGFTVAVQYLNVDAAKGVSKFHGEKAAETIMHEINEAFLGAKYHPGTNYKGSYHYAHALASELDRVKGVDIDVQKTPFPKFDNWSIREKGNDESPWFYTHRTRK